MLSVRTEGVARFCFKRVYLHTAFLHFFAYFISLNCTIEYRFLDAVMKVEENYGLPKSVCSEPNRVWKGRLFHIFFGGHTAHPEVWQTDGLRAY